MSEHRKPRTKINRLDLPKVRAALESLVIAGHATKSQAGFYAPLSQHARNLLGRARTLGTDLEVKVDRPKPKKATVEEIMGRLNRQVGGNQSTSSSVPPRDRRPHQRHAVSRH